MSIVIAVGILLLLAAVGCIGYFIRWKPLLDDLSAFLKEQKDI